MNDIRRTILWVIFGFSMVLLWDQWQTFNGKQATFFPKPTPVVTASNAPATPGTSAAAVPAPNAAGVPAPVATAAGPSAVPLGSSAPAAQASREKLVVTTDVFSLTFDTEGGSLVKSSFVKFKDMADKNAGFVLLDESAGRVYVAQTGLIAFVGLAAPHLVRSVLKTTHGQLILLASLVGGVLLMAADTLARWLIAPQELPVGVLTAVLGGGYLLWLMHRGPAKVGSAL